MKLITGMVWAWDMAMEIIRHTMKPLSLIHISAERGATIQQTIQDAISVICQQPVSITGSGRTDAQVHAWGQVFHFDVDFSLNAFQWKRAINGHLPKDIHIRSVEAVDSRFHARFDAIGKR